MKLEQYIENYFIKHSIPLELQTGISTVKMAILGSKAGCSTNASSKFCKKWFPNKPPRIALAKYILNKHDLKCCYNCNKILEYSNFSKSKNICKICDSLKNKKYYSNNRKRIKENNGIYNKYWKENNRSLLASKEAARRAAKLNRTPSWANLEKIKEFYLNCPEGYHVDHIIPLQGETISGLHVETNLQYLPAKENLSKGNKWPNKWSRN